MSETTLLYGWGRAAGTAARVVRPGSVAALESAVASSDRFIARGLGRAYGDAAQCAGGTVLETTDLGEILSLDVETGIVRAEAGCSFAALLRFCVPRGWFVPVTPGTAHVTVGGAVAADVHGKNHHRDGSISRHVRELRLATPSGSRTVTPDDTLFWATCGGMGLTGVVTEVALELIPIESASMVVDTERARDLAACLELLAAADEHARYSVAWVDGRATGRALGRSVVARGEHAVAAQLAPRQQLAPLAYEEPRRLSLSVTPPASFVNPWTLAAFNALWYRRAPRQRLGEIQGVSSFFYPLDVVGGWNRLYGPRGFTQYQLVVPFDRDDVVRASLERLQRAGAPSSLVVLKRFGESSPGPLSFPMPGWTLALDVPLGAPDLSDALDDLDAMVADAGGRVYLAKDGRLRPEYLRTMYPRLDEFADLCRTVDPDGVIDSDLARRLGVRATDPTRKQAQ